MLDFLVRGGWALWVIAGCSILSLAVTLERWLTMRQADVDSEDLLSKVSAKLESQDVDGAIQVCETAPGPVAETLGIGLRKLTFLERIGKRPEEIEGGIVQAMEDHGGHVVDYLERNLNMLATTASLAPILGMLGTVVGMIRAFGDVSKMGTLTPTVVAGGISEALLCTAGGLIVAAMATVEYNYFVGRVNRFVLKVQAAGTTLVERVLNSQSKSRPADVVRQ
ncbi:MAG TPA: MotA/TolQ/ExbB proton channel family protein [Tepidisphaeraceae bacterium]|nr:MotA/TolQ/ExbB proton channel family protein [Tepidisphaeraceae bacterium]